MKPRDPLGGTPCQVCGHPKEIHMMVCGDRDCDCLCFLPPSGIAGLDEDSPVDGWQEQCIFAVLNLILDEEEGEIHIRRKNGGECHVKVTMVLGMGAQLSKAVGKPS